MATPYEIIQQILVQFLKYKIGLRDFFLNISLIFKIFINNLLLIYSVFQENFGHTRWILLLVSTGH
jgi:uncharacterized membrane protein